MANKDSNGNKVVFLNRLSRICKRLPMSKRVKGETNIIFVDNHYVPYGEVYCEGIKDHYVHYGHYKELDTARAIVAFDLLSKGQSGSSRDLNSIELTQELVDTLEYNKDLKRLMDLAVKEMFLMSLNFLDNQEEDLEDLLSQDSVFNIVFDEDIPF